MVQFVKFVKVSQPSGEVDETVVWSARTRGERNLGVGLQVAFKTTEVDELT